MVQETAGQRETLTAHRRIVTLSTALFAVFMIGVAAVTIYVASTERPNTWLQEVFTSIGVSLGTSVVISLVYALIVQ